MEVPYNHYIEWMANRLQGAGGALNASEERAKDADFAVTAAFDTDLVAMGH
jgi:hypothetical protein